MKLSEQYLEKTIKDKSLTIEELIQYGRIIELEAMKLYSYPDTLVLLYAIEQLEEIKKANNL